MNTANEPNRDLFDLDLELVEQTPATAKTKCLNTALQSGCGGTFGIQQG
ncbi:hypothetical protein [Kribbella sp.]|nr:hypothetical protein [Kribbella sp.]HZX04040.1 hypothetical protein [Kribbella sp.]